MSQLSALMRTTAARLSALYLLLFALCAVLLVFYTTGLSVQFLSVQTQEALSEEIDNLGAIYRQGGMALLVRTIDHRARQPGAYLYLIADPAGQILAGNVESIEPGTLQHVGWINQPIRYRRFMESDNEVHLALARVFELPNGMRLLVGRDLGEPEHFRTVVRRSLVAALGIMSVGGFLIWFFVGRRALQRMDRLSIASQSIMGGDLSGRLPVTGSGDEFDRLADNLNRMLARIQELNEGLRQVSDNIAHDLKTPLTRLRNRAEAALAGTGADGPTHRALEEIIGESDQLIKTFNAILMISRLEAGYSSEALGPTDLAEIVRDVGELYEPLAEEAGVDLQVEIPETAVVKGNRELIGQTISNLVDNALKYGTRRGEPSRVMLCLVEDDGEYRVTIADAGPGIPVDMRERVTERFVRLEESRTRPGSGLGLSLAKAVMKLHSGALRLEDNAPGLRALLVFPKSVGEG